MPKIFLSLLFSIFYCGLSATAQDILGDWHGLLKGPGFQLRIVFHIEKTDAGYVSSMDSPDQGAQGIPMTTTEIKGSKIKLSLPQATIEYEGELTTAGTIAGVFKQHRQKFELDLQRQAVESNRPQEPRPPYPYREEEVRFRNKEAGIELAGTLTLPEDAGPFAAAILISGSGPQNRDEELFGHKPFFVLADYLTRKGYAVLRYDDRGTHQSQGDFSLATSADFATDAAAAIDYLKTRREIDGKKIGLIGHSEGGLIATMLAAGSEDVAFVILLAAPGMAGNELLLAQQQAIGRAAGMDEKTLAQVVAFNSEIFQIVRQTADPQKRKSALSDFFQSKNEAELMIPEGTTKKAFVEQKIAELDNPWLRYFLSTNPERDLRRVRCPVLALNGSKDLQVPASENLARIKGALLEGGNKRVEVAELPGLNHLFQESGSGLPAEYGQIEETFSPKALLQISEWLDKQL